MAPELKTAEELAALAARLASRNADIGALGTLGAVALEPRQRETLGLLGRNGDGKSRLCDMIVLSTLPGDGSGLGELCADQELPPKAEARLLLEAKEARDDRQRAYTTLVNPNPWGHPDHLHNARNSYQGYFKNNLEAFSNGTSVLLPVGNQRGSTTQVQMRISYDDVTACLIQPRTLQQLEQMAADSLEVMSKMAAKEEDVEDSALAESEEFRTHSDVFKVLTGHSVIEEFTNDRSIRDVLAVLEEAHSKEKPFLLPQLAEVAQQLKALVCIGVQDDLSSDLFFVKQAITNPVEHLLGSSEAYQDLLTALFDDEEDGIRSLQGMLLDYVEVTVPCRALGRITLVDLPGLDDSQPLVNFTIQRALGELDAVAVVVTMTLKNSTKLLRTLTGSEWMARQLADRNARGTLMVIHRPERVEALALKDLWSGKWEDTASKNHGTSRKELSKLVKVKLAPSSLLADEKTERVTSFIMDRTVYITVHPATFCSVGVALAAEVHAALLCAGADVPPSWSHEQVVGQLTHRTNMHILLQALGKLSSFRDLQQLDALSREVARTLSILPAEDNNQGLPPGQAEQFGDRLNIYTNNPGQIDAILDTLRGHPSAALRANLQGTLGNILAGLIQEYEDVLKDGDVNAGCQAIAAQAIASLKESAPTMGKLRRLCTAKKILRVTGLPDVVGTITAQLRTTAMLTLQERRRAELLQAHRTAAEAIAMLLDRALRQTLQGKHPKLLLYLLNEGDMWEGQLVSRISDELFRAAEYNLLEGRAFDAKLEADLHRTLKKELLKADLGAPKGQTKISRFWEPLQAAIVSALREFRGALPRVLQAQLVTYIDSEVFAPLLQPVKSRGHQIIAMEEQPGQNMKGGLAERRVRQPCLMRCTYRFFRAVISRLEEGQDAAATAQRAAAVQQLRDQLAELALHLEESKARYRAPASFVQQELGNTMAHRALQRVRQSQVVDLKSKMKLPVGLATCHRAGAGYTSVFNIVHFTVHCGQVDLPPALPEDSQVGLQALFGTLAKHKLLCDSALIPEFGCGSALEAGWLAVFGKGPRNKEGAMTKLRELVSMELSSKADKLEQDLARVYQYNNLSCPATTAYLNELESKTRWTSLLELQGLAAALEVNFIVCTTELDPESVTGRTKAYLIWGGKTSPQAHIGLGRTQNGGGRGRPDFRLIGYPLAVCMRTSSGRVRPWFLPLFQIKDLGPVAAIAGDEGASSSAGLRGSPAEVRRTLAMMAGRAARSQLAPGLNQAEAGWGNQVPQDPPEGPPDPKRRRITH